MGGAVQATFTSQWNESLLPTVQIEFKLDALVGESDERWCLYMVRVWKRGEGRVSACVYGDQ